MRRSVLVLMLCSFAGAARADLMHWDVDEYFHPGFVVDEVGELKVQLPWGPSPVRYLVRLSLGEQSDDGILVSPGSSVVLDWPKDIIPLTATLVSTEGRDLSEPYTASVVFAACEPGTWAMLSFATALRQPAPTWSREPETDGLRILADGTTYLRFRARAQVLEAFVRVQLLAPDGRLIYRCVDFAAPLGAYRQGNQMLLRLPRIAWPDRLRAELTLVDGAGRTSDTRVLDVPVVRHGAPAAPIAERLLLFVVLPFLVGYLAGGRLARARRRVT